MMPEENAASMVGWRDPESTVFAGCVAVAVADLGQAVGVAGVCCSICMSGLDDVERAQSS